MPLNYLYNATSDTKFVLPDEPFREKYGVNKILIGNTFGNEIKPVQMFRRNGNLYLSNAKNISEDILPIEQGLRDRFDRVSREKLEVTEDNPIVWCITKKLEISSNNPVYLRVIVLSDTAILIGVISGVVKIENADGEMIEIGRCIPARPETNIKPVYKEILPKDMKVLLHRMNPVTKKYFDLTGLVDVSIESDRDGGLLTSIQHTHSVAYNPQDLAIEIARIERHNHRRKKNIYVEDLDDEDVDTVDLELDEVEMPDLEDETAWVEETYQDGFETDASDTEEIEEDANDDDWD